MLPEESLKIKSPFDLWLSEKILVEWMAKEKDSQNVNILQSDKS